MTAPSSTDAGHPVSAPSPACASAGASLLQKLRSLAALTILAGLASLGILWLVTDRQDRQQEVEAEIARGWGPNQTIRGPWLVLPYGEDEPRYLVVAARDLTLDARVATDERRRGQFGAIVYDAELALSGRFEAPGERQLAERLGAVAATIRWSGAMLALGVDRPGTVRSGEALTVEGRAQPWGSCQDLGVPTRTCGRSGLVLASLGLTERPDGAVSVSGKLRLRGTGALRFAPAASRASVTVSSPWPDPSFTGDLLPAESTLTEAGFRAIWRIEEIGAPRFAAPTPEGSAEAEGERASRGPIRAGRDGQSTGVLAMPGESVGVVLTEGVSVYRKITRAAKYGLLPVVLAFALLLGFEVMTGLHIHLVQYALVGAAMTLFALMLLAFGEWIGYGAAFAASAGLVVAQASAYTAAVSRNLVLSVLFAGLMSMLFGFLYVILDLEAGALLVGTLALFVVVSAAMALSLRLDLSGASTGVAGQ